MKKMLLTGTALLLCLLIVSPSSLYALTFNVTKVNESSHDYGNLVFGTLDITLNGNVATFTIDIPDSVKDTLGGGDNFGVHKVAWNNNYSDSISDWTLQDDTWGQYKTDKNVGSFGEFDFEVSNRTPSDDKTQFSFNLEYTGSLPDGPTVEGFSKLSTVGEYIAIHLQAYDYNGYTSEFIAGTLANPVPNANPVPEPATIFLLGSGLLGMLGMNKRKGKEV